jgi:hypothetical protein
MGADFANPWAAAHDGLVRTLAQRELQQRQREDHARKVADDEFQRQRQTAHDHLAKEQFLESAENNRSTQTRLTEQSRMLNEQREELAAATRLKTEQATAQAGRRQQLVTALQKRAEAGDKDAQRTLLAAEYEDAFGTPIPAGALNDPEELARIKGDIQQILADKRASASGGIPVRVMTTDENGNAVTQFLSRSDVMGQTFGAAPTSEQRNRIAATDKAAPVLTAISELSERINTARITSLLGATGTQTKQGDSNPPGDGGAAHGKPSAADLIKKYGG